MNGRRHRRGLRLGPILTVVDVLAAAADHVLEVVAGPECPFCRERTRASRLTVHIFVNHAEELRP